MRRTHRPLAAVIAVLVVAAGLAAAGHRRDAREPAPASASSPAGGYGFDALPSSVTAPETGSPRPPRPAPVVAPDSSDEVALESFSGCDALLDHVRTEGLARVTPYGLPHPGGFHGDVAVDRQTAPAQAATSDGAGAAGQGGAYTTTNVQEQGVDEPDIVKNDGARVFTVFDTTLRAHALTDDGMTLTDEVNVPAGSSVQLLLVGDRVVVLTDQRSATRVQLYDATDPDELVLVNDLEVEGSYVSSRAAAGVVRIVTTADPSLPFVRPGNSSEQAKAEALSSNRRILESATVDDWLPQIREVPTGQVSPAVPCTRAHATASFSGFNTTSVLTLDPSNGTFGEAASVLSDAHEVYASPHNLYVATSAWPAGPDEDRAPPQTTQIHQFDISDPQRAVYTASGVVAGHLIRPFLWGGGSGLAQWALSEHDGHLRVANTVGDPNGTRGSVSSVTVLRRQGDLLVPVGAVSGLGVGERVYAVRFMGDRGYVVTYRQVDPLYVLDVADPEAPRLLGELKVPGFSAYLHPVGDGLLLGIGQEDANEDGMVEGLQASLFDVSDPADPKQLDRIQLGDRGMGSLVESDHRAFTWWAEPGRAVLPVTQWHRDGFVGAIGLGVHDGGLEDVGRVAHLPEDDSECRYVVERSRVMNDTVYTFSAGGVWSNAVVDFSPGPTLRYPGASGSCHHPYEPAEPPPSSTTTTTTTTTTTPGPIPLP